jgi:hypothetical protein
VPSVSYDGLSTVLVTPPTRSRLSEYLRNHDNAVKYREWAIEVIKQHVEPGQRALVVCRLDLTEQRGRYLPDWPRDDQRWAMLATEPSGFHWDVGGRRVAVTWWGGDNIGNNAWQEADVVILLDANYKPRRVVVADTQGLLKAHPNTPHTPLAEMTSVRRKHAVVDGYAVGGLLRAHKQLALRGKARRFDDHGRCAPQKLVCGLADQRWLLENFRAMFPGAAPPRMVEVVKGQQGSARRKATYAERLLALLSDPETPATVSTGWIGDRLGKPWRDIRKRVLEAVPSAATLGWAHRPGVGRAPGEFQRAVMV